MTTPINGAISFSQVRSELGLSGAISLSTTLVRQLSNQMSGTVALGNARAAKYVNSTLTNQTAISNFFASSGVATSYKILIGTSGVIGATSGNTALIMGQFPTGSTITLNNYGQIGGYGGAGGAPTGSAGGDAIYALYGNQTVVINNQAGAFIRAGGGGGGRGGTGGTGGGGYYTYQQSAGGASGNVGKGGNCDSLCNDQQGGGAYCGSGCVVGKGNYRSCSNCVRNATAYTSGGAGGAGGNGGVGQGYNQSNAGGSAGNAGAFGGTNAGRGGTGGTGGTGGVWGTNGSNGATGSTGASGNNGGGSAGAGGSSGGSAGRYLVKGGNSVTLNNSGTLAGGLA